MTGNRDRDPSRSGTWLGIVLALVTFALIVAVLIQNLRSLE